MTAAEWMRANKEKYTNPNALARGCMGALHLGKSGKIYARAREIMGSPAASPAKQAKPASGALTEADIRARHDSVFRVREAAKALQPGVYVPEAEFISELRLVGGYRTLLERAEFQVYRGKAPGGSVYWGHPESIKALKDDHVLV
jgi:hypothetical protein